MTLATMLLPLLLAFSFGYSSAELYAHSSVVFPDHAVDFFQNKPASTQCISAGLQACQVQFNNYLGIQSTLDWHDAPTFYNALNERIYNNTAGLIQVCGAYSQFYQCLGLSYSSCIDPLNFISQGYTVTQSFQYVQAIHGLSFKCGGGFEQSVMQWQGIIDVYNTQQAGMEACFNTFINSINQNFTGYCNQVYFLENCFSSLFYKLGPGVVWWACEDIRVGFSYKYCPDAGHLVCQVLRFRDAMNENAKSDVNDVDEYGINKINIGLSRVVQDYPPKPDEDTA